MSRFQLNDAVRYYSSTHKQWVPCLVVAVDAQGSVQITCKPNEWIPLSVQKDRLDFAESTQAGSSKKTSEGYNGGQGVVSAASDRTEQIRKTGGRSEAASRKTVRDAAPSQEQMQKIRCILESRIEINKAALASFRQFDEDGDRMLNHEELSRCLQALKEKLGIPSIHSGQIQSLIAKFDIDGNGALDEKEFEEFFEKVLIKSRQCFQEFKVKTDFFVQKQAGSPLDLYNVVKALGEGSFGKAELIQNKSTGVTRVLKTINKRNANMEPQELEQEINSLKMLDHPHIIRLFEYFEDSENIYLTMEAAEGGELLKVIEDLSHQGWRVSESWSATVMKQVLEAITYCHGRRLMHKDLKAENIMLLNSADSKTSPHAVIIDLGLAEMFGSSQSREDGALRDPRPTPSREDFGTQDEYDNKLYQHFISRKVGGTPITMAPEVWKVYMLQKGHFGLKCDIYSLGVVLFQLLTGELPFSHHNLDAKEWLKKIADGPPAHLLETCSCEANALVCKMLAYNPADRPTARQALQDSWFTEKAAAHKDVQLSQKQMLALKNFSRRTDLQKAVTLQIASQLRAADVPKINAIFKKYDTDNTGILERAELIEALKDMGMTAEMAERAADAIDLDKNGTVEYTEFVAACISLFHEGHEAYLWQIFNKLDKDGSGNLTRADIEQLLKEGERHGLGFTPSATEIDKYIADMDKDKNGQIRFEEFVQYFK